MAGINQIMIANTNVEFKCNKESKDLMYVKNHFWSPIQEIIHSVVHFCNQHHYTNILEIGPGSILFPLATTFVGYNEKIKNYISLDIDVEKIPFEDKHFDFIYSRHTMEDIQNPDFSLREIIRTSHAGYIETPSPLVEVMKGIDSWDPLSQYAGYAHHRYIVWSNIEKGEIYFLPKYGILDHVVFDKEQLKKMYNIVNNYPLYWNNYFIWKKDTIPKIIMYKNGINFRLGINRNKDYINLVNSAISQSINNTNYFMKHYFYPLEPT